MKRVWKCDFCTHTESIINKMIEHESNCSFNPKLKLCNSCEHQILIGYDLACECKIHDLGYYIKVEEGYIKYNDWQNNKLRIKKLNNLIKILK